jgi:transglutaminase-like putative cysteine protease
MRLPVRLLASSSSFALVIGLAGCATHQGGAALDFVPVDLRGLPAADGAPARVLLDEKIVRFESGVDGPVAVETTRRQRQVFTAAGQPKGVQTGYSSSFDRVEQFSVRVADAGGQTLHEWGRKDAVDVPAFPDFVLYSDRRVLSVAVPDQPAGNVVESIETVRHARAELFSFAQMFGSDVPVAHVRFVVEVPAGFSIEHVAFSAGERVDNAARVEHDGTTTRYVWERAALPAIAPEERAPAWPSLADDVTVRLTSWTDAAGTAHDAPADDVALSRYSYGLTSSRAVVTPEIQARVNELLKDVPDAPRAKARRLYAWTRDSIRYCAVEVGIGGWVPHASGDVEKVRYGDCKDKANLLKAMLKAAGINSRLVTIYAGMWPEPFRLPVMGANFNHAILLVDLPEGPAWVDPTTRTTPFDDLPPVDEDRVALPLSDPGSPLTATLPSTPERERRTVDVVAALGADGWLRGDANLEVNGAFADELREALLALPTSDYDRVLTAMLPLEGARASRAAFESVTPPEEVTPARAHGHVDVRVGSGRGDVLLSSRALFSPVVPTIRAERTAPLLLGIRQSQHARATMALPQGARVERVPEPVVVDTPHVRYALSWKLDGDHVVVDRDVVFKVRVVPRAELGTYAAAADQIARAEEMKLIVKHGP